MKHLLYSLTLVATALFMASCGTGRSSFAPENGPPTVGMPAELSERERTYVHNLETVLQNRGYMLVRHGAGDMQLEFQMAEGPINTDTKIELYEGRRILAQGNGRGAGAPMIGRSKVADRSFNRAFEEFQSSLSNVPAGGISGLAPGPGGADVEYVY